MSTFLRYSRYLQSQHPVILDLADDHAGFYADDAGDVGDDFAQVAVVIVDAGQVHDQQIIMSAGDEVAADHFGHLLYGGFKTFYVGTIAAFEFDENIQ